MISDGGSRRLSESEIKARLRRRWAYHEAGHAVAFTALGVLVRSAYLITDEAEAERQDANGQTEYCFRDFQRLSPKLRAIPMIAGDVADEIAEGRDLSEVYDLYLDAWGDPEIADMLTTDWVRLRINFEVAADPEQRHIRVLVRATARILRRHWDAVELCAKQIIEKDCVSSEDIQLFMRKSHSPESTVSIE